MRPAIMLRLLRFDAQRWWWFQTLRAQGRTAEAIRLERESIRGKVRDIRATVGRHAVTYRTSVIEFPNAPIRKPFSLERDRGYSSSTACVSGCHPGFFAAWVHCYAHRIGQFTRKPSDLI